MHKKENQELQQLNALVNLVGSGIFAYTLPERNILMVNSEAKRLFDCPEDDDNYDYVKAIHEKIITAGSNMREETAKLKEPGDSVEYKFRIKKDDGEILTVNCNTKLLTFSDGTQYILSAMIDVTKQEHLERNLAEERSQYRDALTYNSYFFFNVDLTDGYVYEPVEARDGTFIVAPGKPEYYDDIMEDWLGRQNVVFMTKDADRIMKSERMIEYYQSGNAHFSGDYYLPQTGIYYRILILLSEAAYSVGSINANIVVHDITEAKMEDERKKVALEEAYKSANQANEAKTNFFAKMSHDIRTPMNAILGMTTVAKEHLSDRQVVEDCLDKIAISGKHLTRLINEVLDMSKIESGQIELNSEAFDLTDMINELLTIIRPQIENKAQEFSVYAEGLEHTRVIGDSQRLQQVLMNLLGNAVKYTPNGGRIILTVLEVSAVNDKTGCYEFVVEDTGIGMTQDSVDNVFAPFVRADDKRVDKIQGTGLGMTIAQNIVQMMNGTIEVKSELNKGTTVIVTVSLPLKGADVERTMPEEEVAFDGGNRRILVAEDYDMNWEILNMLLPDYHLQLERAANGQLCVDRFLASEEGYYALILMDIRMPEKNGYEATVEIRNSGRSDASLPIIAMSADAFSEDVHKSLSSGMNAHVAKPFVMQELLEVLAKHLQV